MADIQKMGYGYIDDRDESLQSKAGGKFGLNQNVNLDKFELNPNAGSNNSAGDALDVAFKSDGKEFNLRVYPVTKVYTAKGAEITDLTSKEYIEGFNKEVKQKNAVIVHILKAVGVTEEQLKAQFGTPVESFAAFINGLIGLIPSGARSKNLDLFLEYQWEIADGQDRTFLQVPRNMKGGYFVCPAQAGTWTEDIVEGKLQYKNETGAIHPFTRSKDFMESAKAKLQEAGKTDAASQLNAAAGLAPNAGTGTAQTGTW